MEYMHSKIIDLLRRLVSPGIASYYIDAWKLLPNDQQLESSHLLIAHLFREIVSAISDVASQIDPTTRQRIADIDKEKEAKDKHRKKVSVILLWLGFSEQDETWQTWEKITYEDPWKLHGQAHRRTLRTPRPLSREARDRWFALQTALFNILMRLEKKFTLVLRRVTELAARRVPTTKDKKYLNESFPRTFVTTRELFVNIESPGWLKPLDKSHFFDEPPKKQIDPDGTYYLPAWPAAEFLKKMAPEDPQTVVSIIRRVPASGNYYVSMNLLEALNSIQPELAVTAADAVCAWLKEEDSLLIGDRWVTYLLHIGKAGPCDSAAEILRELLDVISDDERSGVYSLKSAKQLEDNTYSEIVKKIISETKRPCMEAYLATFMNLLIKTEELALSARTNEDLESNLFILHDYIRYIEHVEKDEHPKILESLVWAIRELSNRMLQDGDATAFKLLTEQESSYIRRIELYLRSKHPTLDFEQTIKLLSDTALLANDHLSHELALLLEAVYAELPEVVQQNYLRFVEADPDLNRFRQNTLEFEGREPTDEEIQGKDEHWKWQHLCPIHEHLTGEWQERFEALESKFGSRPDLHEYRPRVRTYRVKPESPRPIEELERLSIQELINFANSYTPTEEDQRRLDIDYLGGLEDAIKTLFTRDLNRFISAADLLLELEPRFIRAILNALRTPEERETQIKQDQWPAFVSFFEKLLIRTFKSGHPYSDQGDEESGVSLFGVAISSILLHGLDTVDSAFTPDIQLRDRLWSIIQILMQNRQGSTLLEDEERNPYSTAINTPRGIAFMSMIAYSLWVRRNTEEPEAVNLTDTLPEVCATLEERLDPQREPMIALRSLFGKYFSLLITLDHEWTAAHAEAIFPLDNYRLFNSALIGYLWGRLTDNAYPLLRSAFSKAVQEFGPEIDEKYSYLRPTIRLAGILATAILRGLNDNEDDTDPVTVMEREGQVYIRKQVIEQLGWILCHEALPDEFVARAQNHWERRLEALKESEDLEQWQELAAISEWYASGQFDEDWAITQFEQVLAHKVEITPVPELVATFVERVSENPDRVFDIVRKLTLLSFDSPNRGYIYLYTSDLKPILRVAYREGTEKTQKAVKEFVSQMATRGFTNLLEALEDLEEES